MALFGILIKKKKLGWLEAGKVTIFSSKRKPQILNSFPLILSSTKRAKKSTN
uniref:Uncharacterized protein n=1 Tax=Rhizophora mucronata TaxID=61149 RepID=A0A2P2L0F6_RHIMU